MVNQNLLAEITVALTRAYGPNSLLYCENSSCSIYARSRHPRATPDVMALHIANNRRCYDVWRIYCPLLPELANTTRSGKPRCDFPACRRVSRQQHQDGGNWCLRHLPDDEAEGYVKPVIAVPAQAGDPPGS